ncbi:MAG: zf-HC2 domain-containing protein [Deltaproteobacteria bacterium]|nr:zf-HC2 domain-containing protein [Deltaproteobacteria bacterium]
MNKTVSCPEVRAALTEAAGSPLSEPESAPLREHLAGCPECRRFSAENQSLLDALQQDQVPDPGPEFWNRMTTRIMAEVRHLEHRPEPWYKRPGLNPFHWPVYAWSPLLALLVVTTLWFNYTPVTGPVQISSSGPATGAVSLDEGPDLLDPVDTLTPGESGRLKQKVMAGLTQDLKTDSPVEAVVDWDMSSRFDDLTNEELEKVAKKLQTVGPTGIGEVLHNVS